MVMRAIDEILFSFMMQWLVGVEKKISESEENSNCNWRFLHFGPLFAF